MRNVFLIACRELQQHLATGRAYLVASVFLLLSGVYFYGYLVDTQFSYTSIAGFVQAARILTVLFAAFLTMGLFADERRGGTLELLLTSPISDTQIVLGKFIAVLVVYCGMLALTLYYPCLLVVFGHPDPGPIATSYLGLVLLGLVCLAVGLFAASSGARQITCAAASIAILFGLYYLQALAQLMPSGAGDFLVRFSLASHFASFSRGVIDSADVVYYLSVCGGFLYLSADAVARLRWR